MTSQSDSVARTQKGLPETKNSKNQGTLLFLSVSPFFPHPPLSFCLLSFLLLHANLSKVAESLFSAFAGRQWLLKSWVPMTSPLTCPTLTISQSVICISISWRSLLKWTFLDPTRSEALDSSFFPSSS